MGGEVGSTEGTTETAYMTRSHLLSELTGGRKTQTNAAVAWSILYSPENSTAVFRRR